MKIFLYINQNNQIEDLKLYLNIFVILVSYYSDKIYVCFLERLIVVFKT